MTSIIGIDPGKNGGVAYITEGFPQVWNMPATEKDLSEMLREIGTGEAYCFIEKVHAMPKQGVTSTFTFGQGYGFLRGCLVSHKIPFETVTPRKWQAALSIPAKKKSETQRQHKHNLKQKAQNLYPQVSLTLSTCDALLIAEYGRRLREKT